MKKTKLLLALLVSINFGISFAADKHDAPHWTYEGHGGAEHWADLDKGFAECKLGKEQSPIDIPTKGVEKANLDPIKPAYKASAGELVNNGHTIQINLNEGGVVNVPTGEYKVLQFHFHTPSEEKIDGQNFPLVAHLVHKNAAGQLAVVAILFKEGKENTALKNIFNALPSHEGKEALKADFDLSKLLPSTLGYYTFNGSLTTPPCSEGVAWHVLKTSVEISAAQLNAFKKIFKMNARPVQPLNGRKIQESN